MENEVIKRNKLIIYFKDVYLNGKFFKVPNF
jgi:hypothetical protein